ncbi:NlpC/P60 family protein [Actinomadura logoneensis]|uniref:NlpC/P60 family protein n=1 Tax=Actinomadura logoneensis TaxID=2293572 RepID=A0A372JRL4_9ACTN|nr:C40 family peptidase [Actinomadura logoneensis]RFU42673.1 NlpC/P60 family protein [Actinomadura logoneensis]
MRKPNRRVLPTIIGVSVVTTLAVNTAVLVAGGGRTPHAPRPMSGRFVAASSDSALTPQPVAPLGRRLEPQVMVAGAGTLPADVVAKVRAMKGVQGVETVDAVQAMLGGKRVGLMGVNASTFRGYTPEPTAKSDALWRNVAAGDVAISFTLGSDGGVALGSRVPVGGRDHTSELRVGAYATMGIGDVDAVVSHETARSLGLPSGNAILVSAPKTDTAKLLKAIRKVLPKGLRAVEVDPKIDYPAPGGVSGGAGASGKVMTAAQVRTVIRAAASRIGWPYVWGGESEAEGGYDCSGLLLYAFNKAGIRMPRVAADQARTGYVVPFSKAQPGDLLIWANDPTAPGYISHIALYIGGGKMIVAPHTGTDVQIQNVYFRNFKGAIRVSPQMAARAAG